MNTKQDGCNSSNFEQSSEAAAAEKKKKQMSELK